MLAEAAAALVSAGGAALVSAMVTDSWEGAKRRFARLLGRGDPAATDAAVVRLEESRALVVAQLGAGAERVRAEQEVAWRTRLGDLLETHPEAEGELRAAVAQVQAQAIGSAGQVQQHVLGFDQAQQAVQGHGVQTNRFGQGGEPDAR